MRYVVYDVTYGAWQSEIFEILNINGGLNLKSFEDFGVSMKIDQTFPNVITSRGNGKFILRPEKVTTNVFLDIEERLFFIEVEELENGSFNWSSINFPLNISDEVLECWILQI